MSESFKQYKILSEYFIDSIHGLLDYSNSINIIPIKYSIFIKTIKTYINDCYETAIKEKTINPIWTNSLNCITKKYMLYLNGSV